MKKTISFILALVFVISCFCFGPVYAVEPAASANGDLVTEETATYKDGNKYSGKQVASHINVSDYADFTIAEDGGTHIDGDGNNVYSNYVIFNINLNFDKVTKYILDTGARVTNDKCDWNETPYASEGDTEQYIAYGAFSATRKDANGNVFKYEPIFSKGNTFIDNMIFNEDGDYTVFALFETVKDGTFQNHVLSWSFKIRSYIYLIDEETQFPIKESGISSKNVVLDYAGRQNVTVECLCNDEEIDVFDGFVLSTDIEKRDKYQFTVKSNGFVCETFTFYIDSINPTSQILFSNLRKQTGENSYEAENHFYITWTNTEVNPFTVYYEYYDFSSSVPTKEQYVDKTVLSKVGLYHVYAESKTHIVDYWIELIEKDTPAYNLDALSGERFNNFKTKWYEVYDDINNRFLCFDVEEYGRAYEAAMTIENSSVSANSGKYLYNDQWYEDRIDLTAAMNEYVFANNLKLVYYDPSNYSLDDESERTFSSTAFDRTRYLNDEFQFVKSHSSETNTVILTDNNGRTYGLEYFKPVSEQGVQHGEYKVTETDVYGNSVSYSVYRDKEAPSVTLLCGETKQDAQNGGAYSSSLGFSISKFEDLFDAFAVLKIVKPNGETVYYYQNEYVGIVFEEKGEYQISAYDRNVNAINFSITLN